jgi:hypothetical protein
MKLKTMKDRSFNITQYTFECAKVIFCRSMHILANGIDTKWEIKASNGQLLQSTTKRPKKSGI